MSTAASGMLCLCKRSGRKPLCSISVLSDLMLK